MLTLWIKLTFRNALKFRLFTFVNILSLAIGFACCLAILLYVQDELAYDAFHQKKSRIARITTTSLFNNTENRYSRTPVPLTEHIRDVKGIEKVGRLSEREATLFIAEKQSKVLEGNFYFADPEILSIFSFIFLHGNPQEALKGTRSVILSESIAKKYFNTAHASIGKIIRVENLLDLEVRAVIKDWPATSHIHPQIITNFENYFALENENVREYLKQDWMYTSVFTYISMRQGADIIDVGRKINLIRENSADERVKKNIKYSLQPLTKIHLYSNFSFETPGGLQYIYIFSVVGFLILVIACFNFINLSIARSLRRQKEIAMKKALGMNRNALILQLLGESLVYAFFALLLGLSIVHITLPFVNALTQKQLSILNLFSTETLPLLTLIIFLTGMLAGAYPAFHIASINIYKALKGEALVKSGKFQVRKVLVVFQFLIAMSLIMLTLLVNKQLKFVGDQPLGFDKGHILTIPLFSENFNSIIGNRIDIDYRKRMIAFEEAVLQNSNVQAITCSSFLPGYGAISALIKTDSLTDESNVFIPLVSVDYDFIDAYQIRLIEGRNFSKTFGTDHLQAFIINEEAVKRLGFKNPGNAIGKTLSSVGKEGRVVGVIGNYHIQGLQYAVQPLVLEVAASKFSSFSVKINSSAIQSSVKLLEREWNKFFPESVFEYSFLEDELANNYQREQRLASVISYFSIFTYIIAGLGLFGLAVYMNEQRIKEVSIRKVLGATTRTIFITLSSDFIKLIFISFVLAVPFSFYLMRLWLENFYYKTSIGPEIFFMVIVFTALLALIAISYQTLKVSRCNPSDVLKTE